MIPPTALITRAMFKSNVYVAIIQRSFGFSYSRYFTTVPEAYAWALAEGCEEVNFNIQSK